MLSNNLNWICTIIIYKNNFNFIHLNTLSNVMFYYTDISVTCIYEIKFKKKCVLN